jgi:hypothetical protein
MAISPDPLRIEVRLRRHPYPALFDYLLTVPGAQRPAVLRHLLHLGWLAQHGALTAAGAAAVSPADLPELNGAPTDPLELELLQSLAE